MGGFSICLHHGLWCKKLVFYLLGQSMLLCSIPAWSNMDFSPFWSPLLSLPLREKRRTGALIYSRKQETDCCWEKYYYFCLFRAKGQATDEVANKSLTSCVVGRIWCSRAYYIHARAHTYSLSHLYLICLKYFNIWVLKIFNISSYYYFLLFKWDNVLLCCEF